MKYLSKITVLSTLTVLCLFAGCASAPKADLSWINKVGIVQGKFVIYNNSEQDIRFFPRTERGESWLVESFSQKLTAATSKFTIASKEEVSAWDTWQSQRSAMKTQQDQAVRQHQEHKELADSHANAKRIAAANLVREYGTNELRADSQFKGKLLRVNGVIAGIEQDARGRHFVRLTGVGNDSVVVFFNPSETSRVMALNKGNSITIIGTCSGRNLPDGTDTGEILRILGGGKSVNIADAMFPVTAPTALAGAQLDYTGTIDAVIILEVFVPENSNLEHHKILYRIVRARDLTRISHGNTQGSVNYLKSMIAVTGESQKKLAMENYDKILDKIVKDIEDATPQSK